MVRHDSQTADVDGGPLEPLPTSMWKYLQHGIDLDPEKAALIVKFQKSTHLQELVGSPMISYGAGMKNLQWSYTQMVRGVSRLASILDGSGIRPGSILVTMIPNCAEWCLFGWLASFRGLTLASLDMRVLEPERNDELEFFMTSLKPSIIVVQDLSSAQIVQSKFEQFKDNTTIGFMLDDFEPETKSPWMSMAHAAQATSSYVDGALHGLESDDPNRIATILFTSGTSTGRPKGCPRTVESTLHSLAVNCSLHEVRPDMTTTLHTANFRVIAVAIAFLHWGTGATVIMPSPTFSTPSLLEAIEESKSVSMVLVPFQVYACGTDPTFSPNRTKSVEYIYIGGDVVTSESMRMAQSVFPNAKIMGGHGMTEGVGALGFFKIQDSTHWSIAFQDVITTGFALPGTRIKIVNNNKTRQTLKKGEIGELHISSKGFLRRYLNDVQPQLFYEDNGVPWLITGDTAMIDHENRVFIIGRSKDVIKRAGIPIAAAGLESCLTKRYNVKAELIGLPHPLLGQEPWAIVEDPQEVLNKAEMEELIIKTFGAEYALGGVLRLQDIGLLSWPLNATSKVPKLDLQDAALKHLPSPNDV